MVVAKTNSRPAGAQGPRFWGWAGEYALLVPETGLVILPGVVVEGDEPPPVGHPLMWVEDAGPATEQLTWPTDRIWSADELARGALAEHPATVEVDSQPAKQQRADQPSEESTA